MKHKIICGDCIKIMQEMKDDSTDLIITSPPYNKKSKNRRTHSTDTWTGRGAAICYGDFDDYMDESDYQKWQIDIINECIDLLKPKGSFFYNHKNRTVKHRIITPYEWILKTRAYIKEEIVWDRKMIVEVDKIRFYPKTERIFWLIKNPQQPKFNGDFASLTDIWAITPSQKNKRFNHPAPFPLELVENCMSATTEPNDLVLDPFVGSGTTLIEAEKRGRNSIGIDISKEYCESVYQRLKDEMGQTKLTGEQSTIERIGF